MVSAYISIRQKYSSSKLEPYGVQNRAIEGNWEAHQRKAGQDAHVA
jgi:hypothetical protein